VSATFSMVYSNGKPGPRQLIPSYMTLIRTILKNAIPVSQKTLCISITKIKNFKNVYE